MKSRVTRDLIQAYWNIFFCWKATGIISPSWHILDKEAPEEFKQAIRGDGCKVELTPPDMHWRNAAEKAIQTFKGHFISVLAGVSDDFPIHLWDELIPQMVLTLNLLEQSNIAPNVSAYTYHHGPFDYNRMPLALQSNSTINQTGAKLGVNIPAMAGISAHLLTIIVPTLCLSSTHNKLASLTQFTSSTNI